MKRKISLALLGIFALVVLYLLLWPVPLDPVGWSPPPDPGYNGAHAKNTRLTGLETFSLGGATGPEDIALDNRGRIYASTHGGIVVRLDADGGNPQPWADTGGQPLGIDFDGRGNLIVADAYRGLLSIAPSGKIKLLADTADGKPILYADDVDVAADGRIYFSDASTKFGAKASGGALAGSLMDLIEHGGHGRLLVYDPRSGKATTVLDGLNFANGVAVAHDQQSVLVVETGSYRVMRVWLDGPRKGKSEVFVAALPGFPDNISTGENGRFWLAFASPRNKLLDGLAGSPFLRKMIQRLPAFMRPAPVRYGHIAAFDAAGKVVADLQDPEGTYPINTSVAETPKYLYIGSLVAPVLARLPKAKAGL